MFYHNVSVHVWINMHSKKYIGFHSVTISLLSNFTAKNIQELINKKNNPILQCNFHLKKWNEFFLKFDLCFVTFQRKPRSYISFFFLVISNRSQKDIGNRINPAFLLHKENCHHGCGVLPLVFPGSTQEVRACL